MESSHSKECPNCFMTEDFPGVAIEENGSCSICNGYDLVSYAESRTTSTLEELQRIAETMKANRTGKYDCIIGASGGLDSSYVVYVATRVLGLNPLVVNYDHGFSFDSAIENIERMCKDLGVDLRRLESPKRNDRKFVRHTVQALRPIGIYWSVCTFCHYVCSAVWYKVALEENVGYIMGSANPYQKSLHLTKNFRLRRIVKSLRGLGPLGWLRTLYHLAVAQYWLVRVKLDFYVAPLSNLFSGFKPPESVERIDVTKYIPVGHLRHGGDDGAGDQLARSAGPRISDEVRLPPRGRVAGRDLQGGHGAHRPRDRQQQPRLRQAEDQG